MAISVVAAVDFECVQFDWQFAERKWRYATCCEIEPRTALRLGPMHVVRVLVRHERKQCSTKEHGHLGYGAGGHLACRAELQPGETPGCLTGSPRRIRPVADKMPLLQSAFEFAPVTVNRQPGQHNTKGDCAIWRRSDNRASDNSNTGQNKKNRREWMTGHAVGNCV